ncbi:MAG: hypothetical protein RBT37_04600 [Dissulfurispiraceae bacterium]|jgi:hypothetical protein|nr:hypothetical protein [Dissulfurispiraceae bacterium]
MQKIFAVVIALVFALSVAGLSFAADVTGTVSKVEGSKITVKDAKGAETVVDSKDAKVKVGDKVTVKDGKIVGESADKKPSKKKKKAIEGC